MVLLDHKPNWQEKNHLNYFQDSNGKEFKFGAEENLTAEQIFNIGLVGSINQAVNLFPKLSGIDKNSFIAEMNKKATGLGLKKTHFEDIAGLSAKNVSTAAEIATFLEEAFKNEKIYQAASTEVYEFNTEEGSYKLENTNELLNNIFFKILAGKTGSTDEAMFCLAALGEIKGRKIITVVLGASSEDNRFQNTKALYWWVENNYK